MEKIRVLHMKRILINQFDIDVNYKKFKSQSMWNLEPKGMELYPS
jgi:hypothetical protein